MLWNAIPGMLPSVDHPPPSPPAPPAHTGPAYTRPGFVMPLTVVDAAMPNKPPGSVFIRHWHKDEPCPYWDNCNGDHVTVVLPNGRWWDVMARASNCDLRDDKTHRCWVLRGSLEDLSTLTVDKDGHTCGAGQGSIQADDFHGFLRGGQLEAT